MLSIGLDELSAYDKEKRKEYKTIIHSHYELLKDEKRKREGQNGGLTTQQKICDMKKQLKETKELLDRQNDFLNEVVRSYW